MVRLRATVGLALFLVACGGDSTGPSGGRAAVSLVLVSPGASSMLVGATEQLTATITDIQAKPLTGRPLVWRSSDNARAAVNAQGLVTALSTGPVTITATSEGKTGTSTIEILPLPIASISVVPGTATLGLGTTSQLSAVPQDSLGRPLAGRVVTWSSNNTAVSVAPTGMVSAAGLGTAMITATSEGKSGTAAITVTPIPVASVTVAPAMPTVAVAASTPLTATARDANGNVLPDRVIFWSSADTTRARVSATGVVTGVLKGTTIITATSEGHSGSATVTIVPGAPASVTIAPAPLTLEAGDTARLTAVVRDASGDSITAAVTWSSGSTSLATVNGTGLVTGVAEGTVIVTATSGTASGTDTVYVTPAPVTSVTMNSGGTHLGVGGTLQLYATPRGAQGQALSQREITWSSSDSGVATVSSSGLVTGVSIGDATITATCEGQSASTAVVVEYESVASVSLDPPSAAVGAGLGAQFTVYVIGSSGDTLVNRVVTWSSSAPGVATVNANGLVVGVVAGTATITATSEGVSGTADVTVQVHLAFPALDGGYSHTCSLTANGVTYCWGSNTAGELGNGAVNTGSAVPVLVSGGQSFASLYPGGRHTCALTAAGSAWCWGGNARGQLGTGDTTGSARPRAVVGGLVFTQLTGGFSHACGLAASGAAYCWGSNTQGELGNGTATQRVMPTPVVGGHQFVELSARGAHSCGLTSGGAVYCWGKNADGELGDGTTTNRTVPVLVSGGNAFSSITTGAGHTCAITGGGAAYCWGDNSLGEIGDGTLTDRLAPVAVAGGIAFQQIKARGGHTCGIATAGPTYCWGENTSGQLGDGTMTMRTVPVVVQGGHSFTDVSSGATFSCGVTGSPVLYCWGENGDGQLGNGSFANSTVPVKVLGQP